MKAEKIMGLVSGSFLVWIFVSWIDVIAHNLSTQTYFAWNAFELFGRFIVPMV